MELRERLAYAGVAAPAAPARRPESLVPPGFNRGSNRHGEVVYRDRYLPLDHRHGRIALARALDPDPELLARLGDGLTTLHVKEAAFLDIETTGLSGGTGTYAFLVGVGTFDSLTFRVRQFFLTAPAGEAAMLAAIAETVDRCRALVTFNGKSFDLPQLATRYALARMPAPGEGLPHIDLLHPARRLFGRRLESCRLSEIEAHLLGLRRHGDVPSWMIPGLYFGYVRRRDLDGLHPVFEHNSLDVISLAAFLAHLSHEAGTAAKDDPDLLLALARWDESRGRRDEAVLLFERAWRLDDAGQEGAEAAWRLARLLRRSGDWRDARSTWLEELGRTPAATRRVRALVELAKIAEHRERDPEAGLRLALSALAALDAEPSMSNLVLTRERLQHRLQRLRAKTGAAGGRGTA